MTDEPFVLATALVSRNSYVNLGTANEIAAQRLHNVAWVAANDDARARAVITATALLNRLRWQGRPIAPTQPLAWPRVAERCPPGCPLSVETPPAIVTVTVELAIHLLGTGEPSGAPVQQRVPGDSLVMYFPTIADEFPKHVRGLIEPFLVVSSANVAEIRL